MPDCLCLKFLFWYLFWVLLVCLLTGDIQFMKDLKDVAQQKVLQSADLRIEPRMCPVADIRAKDLAFLHPYVSNPYTLFSVTFL